MAEKSSEQDVSNRKRDRKWYCTLCGLTTVTVVVGVLAALSLAKCTSLKNEVEGMMASESLTLSSILPSTESPTLGRATSIESQSNPTSAKFMTSLLETSDTSTPSPIPTSTAASSSERLLSSSTSRYTQSPLFLQSANIDDNLVRRSGYLGQREDASPGHPLDLHSHLNQREDSGDCEDTTTTTTTTLTTTITSTFRTFKSVPSIADSNFASSQLPEPGPTGTDLGFITDTIMHTAGLPASTSISTPSSDMTPPPTLTSATDPPREGIAVTSASSSAVAGRLVAPLAWGNLRRFIPLVNGNDETQQNRCLLPSLTAVSTATTTQDDGNEGGGFTAQLMSTVSSNAAVRQRALHWTVMGKPTTALPLETHERRQAPSQSPSSLAVGGTLTFWQAYSQLRLQVSQMCFSVKTYQNTTLTSAHIQTPDDLELGKELDAIICNSLEQDFPPLSQGEVCDNQSEWLGLESQIEMVCNRSQPSDKLRSDKLGQDVELICGVKKSFVEKVDGCGSGKETGGNGGSLTQSLVSISATFSGKPTEDSGAKSKTDSSGTMSLFSSISLQQNAVENTSPSNTLSPTGPGPISNEPLLITSTANLLSSSALPTPSYSGILPISASSTPASGLEDLPPHEHNTPPKSWTIPMLTYTTQPYPTPSNYKLLTMPTNVDATAPDYTGEHLSKDWQDNSLFPIPTGYVAPHIVPAEPQIGHLTYFNPGVGACGGPDMVGNELAVAISWELFDMGREIGGSPLEDNWVFLGTHADGIDRTSSALCFRGIKVWTADDQGNKLVEQEVVVRDRCTGCNVTHLDIQEDTFKKYWDGGGDGRISVTWEWMQEAPTSMPTQSLG